jgi:C2 domain
MLNSILTARIIEGRGIRASNNSSIVINLQIEGQTANSEPVLVQNGVDPVWKEVISFDIATGRENLFIQVADADTGRLLAQGEVYLEILRDQYKHDEWVQLETPNRKGEPAGRLLFNLHWIHSKRKFLQDILRIQDTALEEYSNEKQ